MWSSIQFEIIAAYILVKMLVRVFFSFACFLPAECVIGKEHRHLSLETVAETENPNFKIGYSVNILAKLLMIDC